MSQQMVDRSPLSAVSSLLLQGISTPLSLLSFYVTISISITVSLTDIPMFSHSLSLKLGTPDASKEFKEKCEELEGRLAQPIAKYQYQYQLHSESESGEAQAQAPNTTLPVLSPVAVVPPQVASVPTPVSVEERNTEPVWKTQTVEQVGSRLQCCCPLCDHFMCRLQDFLVSSGGVDARRDLSQARV